MESKIKNAAIISLLLLLIWIIPTVFLMQQIKPTWTDFDFLTWSSQPDIFYLTYFIIATLITIMSVVLFTFIYIYISQMNKCYAVLGMIFIPIYGILNLIGYSIQISVVPSIATKALSTSENILFASQLIMSNAFSIIDFISGLAYFTLGIPSIIYGYILMKNLKKKSGFSLLISGILHIIGIIGYMLQNEILTAGTFLGVVVFIIVLVFLIFEFRKKKFFKES